MPFMPPMMPPMGPYGPVPFHHPILHSSHAQLFPGPFFYPGRSFGMPGYGCGVSPLPTGLQLPTTQTTVNISLSPSSATSPSTSDVSPNSSDESLNTSDVKKSEYSNMVSPYYHHPNPPYIAPYTPFTYPYGMCPPL